MYCSKVNGIWIIKSGTDFRNFTLLTLSFSATTHQLTNIETDLFDVTAEYTPDKELESTLQVYNGKYCLSYVYSYMVYYQYRNILMLF